MRRALQFLMFLFAVLNVLGAARPASAQSIEALQDTPKLDVFIGYSYFRGDSVVNGRPINLNGGSASLAFNFNRWIGLVGDVGGYQRANLTGNNLSLTISTYQAGPRFTLRNHEHFVPFAQVLVGAGHVTGTLYTTSLGGDLPPIGANNGLTVTAGGGVDWNLVPAVAIRVIQAEYLYSRFLNGADYGDQQNDVRLSAGIVLRFGAR